MVKCLILDQDGTLYPRDHPLILETRRRTKQWIIDSTDYRWETIEGLYERLQKEYPNPLDGFTSIGLRVEDYHGVFNSIDPREFLKKDFRLRRTLEELEVPIFVVTFAPHGYSEDVQSALGVSDLIDKTYSVVDIPGNHHKKPIYKLILREQKLYPSGVLVVGDSYDNDVLPATELGCRGILIPDDIRSIYELQKCI